MQSSPKSCRYNNKWCKNPNCSFYHETPSCRDYNTPTGCNKGDRCPFTHAFPLVPPNAPKKLLQQKRMGNKIIPFPSLDNLDNSLIPNAPLKIQSQTRITPESQPIPFDLNKEGTYFYDENDLNDSDESDDYSNSQEEAFEILGNLMYERVSNTVNFGDDYLKNMDEYVHY